MPLSTPQMLPNSPTINFLSQYLSLLGASPAFMIYAYCYNVISQRIPSAPLSAEREKYRDKPQRSPHNHWSSVHYDCLRQLEAIANNEAEDYFDSKGNKFYRRSPAGYLILASEVSCPGPWRMEGQKKRPSKRTRA